MAKRLMVLVGMLAVLLATAVPALAQQFPPGTITVTGVLGEGARGPDGSGVFSITDETTGEGFIIEVGSPIDQYVGERVEINGIPQPQPNAGPRILDIVAFTPVGGGAPPAGEIATLSFELTVAGDPPAGTQFFGAPGEGGGQFFDAEGNRLRPVPLTDPDGDGVFTGNTTLANPGTGPVVSLPVQIVQENGGNIEVIRDFGVVGIDRDKTFKAKVNFKEDRGGATTPESTTPESTMPDSGNGSSANSSGTSGSGGSGSSGGGAKAGGAKAKELPRTGGDTLPALGLVGVLLVGGGLLVRRVAS